MNFQDWYDNLGPTIPHGHVAQMRMAWDAALECSAKHFDGMPPQALYSGVAAAHAVRSIKSKSEPQAGQE